MLAINLSIMTTFNTKDYYFQRAKADGFKARSVYKLMEIDRAVKLFKPGAKVLDLGSAPGSWLQYASSKIGKHGKALGIDLTPIPEKLAANVVTAEMDVFSLTKEKSGELLQEDEMSFDVVMSDMAPKTTGIKHVDQIRSLNLAQKAKDLALDLLKPGGSVVIKIFNGGDVPELIASMKPSFKTIKQMRPESIRSQSKEFYVVGLHKI